MPVGSSSRTKATTRARCKPTSGTRASNTPCATPSLRPVSSRHFGTTKMIIGYAQKTALISIAVLFLATGTAHASHEYRKCGKTFVDINHAHATIDGKREFWRELTIIEDPK